jgi:hypothetical protein
MEESKYSKRSAKSRTESKNYDLGDEAEEEEGAACMIK